MQKRDYLVPGAGNTDRHRTYRIQKTDKTDHDPCIVGLLVTLLQVKYLYWFTGELTGQTALVQTKYKKAYTFQLG
jgi:hypothetical protein